MLRACTRRGDSYCIYYRPPTVMPQGLRGDQTPPAAMTPESRCFWEKKVNEKKVNGYQEFLSFYIRKNDLCNTVSVIFSKEVWQNNSVQKYFSMVLNTKSLKFCPRSDYTPL